MEQKSFLEQTRELCRQLDIIPTKSKGQNFLINEKVLGQIVEAAELSKTDTVLEIGPGLGILTEKLVERAGRVVAVELDRKLFGYLSKKFKGAKNLELVEGDVIKLFDGQIVGLLAGKEYKVVANLPYQITSHILRILLEGDQPPSEMVVMVQKEVGERICAQPGDMSVLAVMVQYYSQPIIVALAGRDSFWPAPEVDSVIIKLKIKKAPTPSPSPLVKGEGDINEELFFKLVKVGFSGKRKMLKNNLRNVYEEEKVLEVLDQLGLSPKVRAEDLGVEEWVELYKKLGK